MASTIRSGSTGDEQHRADGSRAGSSSSAPRVVGAAGASGGERRRPAAHEHAAPASRRKVHASRDGTVAAAQAALSIERAMRRISRAAGATGVARRLCAPHLREAPRHGRARQVGRRPADRVPRQARRRSGRAESAPGRAAARRSRPDGRDLPILRRSRGPCPPTAVRQALDAVVGTRRRGRRQPSAASAIAGRGGGEIGGHPLGTSSPSSVPRVCDHAAVRRASSGSAAIGLPAAAKRSCCRPAHDSREELRRQARRAEDGGGQGGVALVRHGRGAATAGGGRFQHLADFGLHHQGDVTGDLGPRSQQDPP